MVCIGYVHRGNLVKVHSTVYLAWYFDVRRKYGRVPLLIRDKRVVLAVARVTGRVARVRSAAGSRVSVPPRGARTRLPAALRTRATLPVTRRHQYRELS